MSPRLLILPLAVLLSSCFETPQQGYNPPPLPPLPSPYGSDSVQPYPQAPAAGGEYDSGFGIGEQDRYYGYPADARRAFQRFGSGDERSFSQGYSAGYAGSAGRH